MAHTVTETDFGGVVHKFIGYVRIRYDEYSGIRVESRKIKREETEKEAFNVKKIGGTERLIYIRTAADAEETAGAERLTHIKAVADAEGAAGTERITQIKAAVDAEEAAGAERLTHIKDTADTRGEADPEKIFMTKEASVTIEASLIMPLVLASVIFVILLSFYSHDRCIMLKAGLEAALRAEEDEAEAGRAMDNTLDGIIWVKDIEKDISTDEEEIIVEVKGTAALSEGFEGLLINGASVGYSVKAKGEAGSGSEYIRAVKKRGGGYCY